MPGKVFSLLDCIRIFGSQRQQRLVTSQLIQIPNRSGKESAPPISITAIVNGTVCFQCDRIQAFSTRLNHADLIPYLCTGKIYILVNEALFFCFGGTPAR